MSEYTLIRKVNLIKSGYSNKKFEITFDGINENEKVGNTDNYFTVKYNNKNYCFRNALVYVLFQKYCGKIDDNNTVDKVKIDITADITNITEFNSDKILIKFSQFNYDKYVDTGFGFIGNTNIFIPINPVLFSGFTDDSLKRYALILLEQHYYKNTGQQDKIKELCMLNEMTGGGTKRQNRTRKKSN